MIQTKSLRADARCEADRHKWLESEKRGHDIGDRGRKEWFKRYWFPFCRNRYLEHLQGRECFSEFRTEKFGLIEQLMIEGDLLLDRILDRARAGYELLDIIQWAITFGIPMDRMIQILEKLDLNSCRIDIPLDAA